MQKRYGCTLLMCRSDSSGNLNMRNCLAATKMIHVKRLEQPECGHGREVSKELQIVCSFWRQCHVALCAPSQRVQGGVDREFRNARFRGFPRRKMLSPRCVSRKKR